MDISFIREVVPQGLKPFVKRVVGKRVSEWYFAKWKINKIKKYRTYGLEALQKFDECMRKNCFKYSLAFGTMLGAIREHGFIKHDLDIDTWMFIEDDNANLVPELKKYGFRLLYHYSIDNDKLGKEYTFNYKGCHIDIFFIFPAINKYPYVNDFVEEKDITKHHLLPRRIELPLSKDIRYIQFGNLSLPIPKNAEEICKFRYGEDYMTPNPMWNWIDAKNSVVEWREMIPVTTYKTYE